MEAERGGEYRESGGGGVEERGRLRGTGGPAAVLLAPFLCVALFLFLLFCTLTVRFVPALRDADGGCFIFIYLFIFAVILDVDAGGWGNSGVRLLKIDFHWLHR